MLFRNLRDNRFGRQQQAGDRSSVLQSRAGDLRRIDHAHLRSRSPYSSVSALNPKLALLSASDLVDDNRAFLAGVRDDLTKRLFERAPDDADADVLVVVRRASIPRAPSARE